ncbi:MULTISPECIES: heat shock 70 family protein [unclassified Rhodococcus (in: high G+C Gram-positive bacteria)]|uniref:heat shock 70 family protein n=1 Tax=unclassified Rhodococcus (in: high G+C Gram-positive bacteria) TaxID=192944 RepID=UPI00207863FF|nr:MULTISPECIES: heat shock 70 family protein [unclassified Rhodococcus (in: high G+C Gram-positive bacteria)]
MENQSLETEFAALDEQIRREAEKKMQAIRVVATAHKTLADTREEFARTDAANKKALTDAIADARSAGFTDSDLKRWQEDDNKASRRAPQRRPRKSAQKEQSVTPTNSGAVTASPETAGDKLAASA